MKIVGQIHAVRKVSLDVVVGDDDDDDEEVKEVSCYAVGGRTGVGLADKVDKMQVVKDMSCDAVGVFEVVGVDDEEGVKEAPGGSNDELGLLCARDDEDDEADDEAEVVPEMSEVGSYGFDGIDVAEGVVMWARLAGSLLARGTLLELAAELVVRLNRNGGVSYSDDFSCDDHGADEDVSSLYDEPSLYDGDGAVDVCEASDAAPTTLYCVGACFGPWLYGWLKAGIVEDPQRHLGCECAAIDLPTRSPAQGGSWPVFESGAPSAAAASRLPQLRSNRSGVRLRRWDGTAAMAGASTATRAGRTRATPKAKTPRRKDGGNGSADVGTSSLEASAKAVAASGGRPNGSSRVAGPMGHPPGQSSSKGNGRTGTKEDNHRRPS